MAEAVSELTGLLSNSTLSTSLKCAALKYALGLSMTEEGVEFICQHTEFLLSIYNFLISFNPNELCEIAHNCMLNISAFSVGVNTLVLIVPHLSQWLVTSLFELDTPYIDLKCQILANMTRYDVGSEQMVNYFLHSSESFSKLMFVFLSNDSGITEKYDYLALLFGNLASIPSGESLFLKNDCLKYLLPYTSHESNIRRMGVAILLKNMTFRIEQHKQLLEDIDILPAVLLALAGPEEFSSEENEKLPVDLQYLESTKQHEPNPAIRNILSDALFKLCSTRYGRQFQRDKGAYIILRELHKWEMKKFQKSTCDDVIEILIREETDINAENLMDLHIPEQFVDKFEQMSLTTAQ